MPERQSSLVAEVRGWHMALMQVSAQHLPTHSTTPSSDANIWEGRFGVTLTRERLLTADCWPREARVICGRYVVFFRKIRWKSVLEILHTQPGLLWSLKAATVRTELCRWTDLSVQTPETCLHRWNCYIIYSRIHKCLPIKEPVWLCLVLRVTQKTLGFLSSDCQTESIFGISRLYPDWF